VEVAVGSVFVGHDWAEDHHDVYVEDTGGHRLAKARLGEGIEGVAGFHALVGPFIDEPGEVVIATETDRGLFVGAVGGGRLSGDRRESAVDGPLP
jgi:hypothetical protein